MKKLLPEDLDFISDVAAASSFGVRLRYHLILIVTALFFIVALIWAAIATAISPLNFAAKAVSENRATRASLQAPGRL